MQKAKGESGEPVSTTPPYGYVKNPEYKGNQKEAPWLIVDPEAAAVVKRSYEICAERKGIVKIANTLYAEKILSSSPSQAQQDITKKPGKKAEEKQVFVFFLPCVVIILSVRFRHLRNKG